MVGIDGEDMQYSELCRAEWDWPHDLADRLLSLATLNLVIDRNDSRIGHNLPGATVSSLRWRLGNILGRASLALDEHYILASGAVLFAFPAVGTSVAVGHTVLHGCDNPLGSAILGRPRR